MKRRILAAAALFALLACSPPAADEAGDAAAQAAGAGEPAGGADVVNAWAREQGGGLIEPVSIFHGDFNGDGASDALAWADYDTGGSSANHVIGLFRNEGGRLVFWRTDETVYGSEPRDVSFANGAITLTTTMPNPGDPHCCPTGSRGWTIDANRATPY